MIVPQKAKYILNSNTKSDKSDPLAIPRSGRGQIGLLFGDTHFYLLYNIYFKKSSFFLVQYICTISALE